MMIIKIFTTSLPTQKKVSKKVCGAKDGTSPFHCQTQSVLKRSDLHSEHLTGSLTRVEQKCKNLSYEYEPRKGKAVDTVRTTTTCFDAVWNAFV